MAFIVVIVSVVFSTTYVYCAPPSRVSTYTSGEIISSSDVTANEDAIFNYLQAGVDTYADLSIVNADVSATANVQSDKLNLTSIAQAVGITAGGSLTNAGTSEFTGNTTFAGITIADLGTVTTAAFTTITDLGNVTTSGTFGLGGKLTAGANEIEGSTFDINGGTADSLNIASATTTGTIFYNDASDDTVALVPGADGLVLTSTGTTGIPAYEITSVGLLSTTTLAGDTNSGNITITAGSMYKVFVNLTSDGADTTIQIRFDSDSGAADYAYTRGEIDWAGAPSIAYTGDDSNGAIVIGIVNASKSITGWFTINADADADGDIYLSGKFMAEDGDGTDTQWTLEGAYRDAGTLTDFEMTCSAACSGTILTYQYSP